MFIKKIKLKKDYHINVFTLSFRLCYVVPKDRYVTLKAHCGVPTNTYLKRFPEYSETYLSAAQATPARLEVERRRTLSAVPGGFIRFNIKSFV